MTEVARLRTQSHGRRSASRGSQGPQLPALRREGYLMYYDTSVGEWLRVYVTLTDTMQVLSAAGPQSRPMRAPIPMGLVSTYFCSVGVPDAPARHVPLLAALVNNSLCIFRSPESRLMAEWRAALQAASPDSKWCCVADMEEHRALMTPQLFGTLFRPDAAAHGPQPAGAKGQRREGPATGSAIGRRASLSADCPRRGPMPMRRAVVNAAPRPHRHVDATTNLLALVPPKERAALQAVSASVANASPKREKAEVVVPASVAANANVSAFAAPYDTTERVALQSALEASTRAEKALAMKVRDLRVELDGVSARNIDLEIDNANIGARVLELEGEVESLKAGVGEWRRRYHSLEQQLACQELAYKQRVEDEKSELIGNIQAEVGAQLEVVRGRFRERESELLERIRVLEAASV